MIRHRTLPLLVPIAAGLSVVCASTALSGVIVGIGWLWYLTVAVVTVVIAGLALRALRLSPLTTVLGQMVALLLLLTGMFSTHGLLVILPVPAAFSDLASLLHQSVVEVQTKVPPVDADPPILCLTMICIGLVAVLVDLLAVSARAPAATGLVLLCVFAVPASLSTELLPWWSFTLGAVAFALLLAAAEYETRLRWRGPGYRAKPSFVDRLFASTTAIIVVSVSLILALVVGSQFTLIGTSGRLPGFAGGSGGAQPEVGIKPFTKLSGLLNDQGNEELFRVHGLPSDAYLRAVTLSDYQQGSGWGVGILPTGGRQLGNGESTVSTDHGDLARVTIQPTTWRDIWLPLYGKPVSLSGLDSSWNYDPITGTVYSAKVQHASSYVETANLREPTIDELRAADSRSAADLDPRYRAPVQVSTAVRQLVQRITESQPTTFEKAAAIYRYFTDGKNGFSYTLHDPVRDPHIDQLDDFLFNSKAGFCEQYASAMAAMLRSIGVPTRVAIGFTAGVTEPGADYRSIRASDAHAWVEVYFPGDGWVQFDPTPLSDGRGIVPPYLRGNGTPSSTKPTSSSSAAPPTSNIPNAQLPTIPQTHDSNPNGQQQLATDQSNAVGLAALWVAVIAAVCCILLMPLMIRRAQRQRRRRVVASLSPAAPEAAWRELLAEIQDRGGASAATETVRATCRRIADEYHLDESGKQALRQLISVVEQSRYSDHFVPDHELTLTMQALSESLHRNAPLSLLAKLFPRSVWRIQRFTR